MNLSIPLGNHEVFNQYEGAYRPRTYEYNLLDYWKDRAKHGIPIDWEQGKPILGKIADRIMATIVSAETASLSKSKIESESMLSSAQLW